MGPATGAESTLRSGAENALQGAVASARRSRVQAQEPGGVQRAGARGSGGHLPQLVFPPALRPRARAQLRRQPGGTVQAPRAAAPRGASAQGLPARPPATGAPGRSPCAMALRDCVAWVETRVAVSLWIAALFGTVVSILAACVCLPHPAAVLWLCLQVRFPFRVALHVVPGVQAYLWSIDATSCHRLPLSSSPSQRNRLRWRAGSSDGLYSMPRTISHSKLCMRTRQPSSRAIHMS